MKKILSSPAVPPAGCHDPELPEGEPAVRVHAAGGGGGAGGPVLAAGGAAAAAGAREGGTPRGKGQKIDCAAGFTVAADTKIIGREKYAAGRLDLVIPY